MALNAFCKFLKNGKVILDIAVGEATDHIDRVKIGIQNDAIFDSYILYYRDKYDKEFKYYNDKEYHLGFKIPGKSAYKANCDTYEFEEKLSDFVVSYDFKKEEEIKGMCRKLGIPFQE